MPGKTLRIALASLAHPRTISQGLEKVEAALEYGASHGAEFICFPETYLPGLRGADLSLPPPDREVQDRLLKTVRGMARAHGIATIIGMEWPAEEGLLNLAYVISSRGRVLGYQAKNQITPGGESRNYAPDAYSGTFRPANPGLNRPPNPGRIGHRIRDDTGQFWGRAGIGGRKDRGQEVATLDN